jgi:hypothetical protein
MARREDFKLRPARLPNEKKEREQRREYGPTKESKEERQPPIGSGLRRTTVARGRTVACSQANSFATSRRWNGPPPLVITRLRRIRSRRLPARLLKSVTNGTGLSPRSELAQGACNASELEPQPELHLSGRSAGGKSGDLSRIRRAYSGS